MKFSIDNRTVEVKEDTTILQAAEAHDIYIPHLCSHPELTPYGGCRLCIVEVEGMRGYPTACTTITLPDMTVRTQTKTLQEMRQEILQLILSEHPAACLVCSEAKECTDFQQTIRKVGMTTGCRWCPKDEDCELQKVVRSLGVEEITFPVSYRGLPHETEDPFFDRDYNLCIYCGRCVRICQEQRRSAIITLKQRGRATTIGPAFTRSHLEANCEFCGACVSVCPTGAMSEKGGKWNGVTEAYHASICPLCSMNCDLQVARRGGAIIGTLPPGDPRQTGGELCVKGRFCLSAWVNHPDRQREPQLRYPAGLGTIAWEEAIHKASEWLKETPPKRTAVFLSADLTLEEMAAGSTLFAGTLGVPHITSSALDQRLLRFLSLPQQGTFPKILDDADLILSAYFNGNWGYAPLTLAIKRRAARGIPYLQVGWVNDPTSRFAECRFLPTPGREERLFDGITEYLKRGKTKSREAQRIAVLMQRASSPVFVLSTSILDLSSTERVMDSLTRLATLVGARLVLAHPFGNLTGLLSLVPVQASEEVLRLIRDGGIDTLHLVGDNPFATTRPAVKAIIYQGVFPPPEALAADLILPSTTFGEAAGSYYDGLGMRRLASAAIPPPDMVMPTHLVLTRIAQLLDKGISLDPKKTASTIPDKAKANVPAATPANSIRPRSVRSYKDTDFILVQERNPHRYHDVSLNAVIPGMRMLLPEDTLIIHPSDAERIGVGSGDAVEVRMVQGAKVLRVEPRHFVPRGVAYLVSSAASPDLEPNPQPVHVQPFLEKKKGSPGARSRHV